MRVQRTWRVCGSQAALLACLAGSLLLPGAAVAQDATPAATPVASGYGGVPSAAILASATTPRAIIGSDGQRHVNYDLLITNTYLAPVTLSAIDTLAADGTRLQTLSGDDLVTATQPVLGAEPQAAIPPSATVAVVMDLPLDPALDPGELDHAIRYEVPADAPDQALLGTREVFGPRLRISPQEPVVIAPPLAGDGWVALNGCCSPRSVHRYERVSTGTELAKAEMFAIDWVSVRDGQFNSGDGARNEDYYAYGAEVRAVAPGTVVYVRNDAAEQTPGEPLTGINAPQDFGGNQVMVEIGPGLYAWYAHLQPGSVLVDVGDEVKTGQPLGKLGNSGQSTSPHLHFGLLDAPNSATGNSVPVAIDAYDLVGVIPEAVMFADTPPPDGRVPVETTGAGPRAASWPLYLTVVNFP